VQAVPNHPAVDAADVRYQSGIKAICGLLGDQENGDVLGIRYDYE